MGESECLRTQSSPKNNVQGASEQRLPRDPASAGAGQHSDLATFSGLSHGLGTSPREVAQSERCFGSWGCHFAGKPISDSPKRTPVACISMAVTGDWVVNFQESCFLINRWNEHSGPASTVCLGIIHPPRWYDTFCMPLLLTGVKLYSFSS